jgi:cation transport regulator
MPYMSNDDFPPSVRDHLSEHALDIYREAFNHAWQEYAGDPRQEEIAHRVAWAAVKRSYVKVGAEWMLRRTRALSCGSGKLFRSLGRQEYHTILLTNRLNRGSCGDQSGREPAAGHDPLAYHQESAYTGEGAR